ncbi:DUF1692-domain-containing protein [Fomitiporia mediterranea MF3/22]|uniref:DUF1692-domain-containing protein n=1 Tax=Fomitiporia mediterranea (strain MF3/22) TaxID=694068 RepID=UPI000440910C|nr:DUF1692-domain-containing protein [Fomitiporia mediterranea MF3/22]EJD06811.1 DUF1692-domain-containing protein [Fomitiporia mediterranea MF3/22]
MSVSPTDESILDKLDKIAPAALNQFDAFPKLPSTYKARSGGRGFLTVLVAFISFLLVVNDIGEYIFGWPTYKFGLDNRPGHYLAINVDLVVNMPCKHLSVDLRDAVGDRLYLSDGFKRDGTLFDIGQAQALQSHTQALDARLAVAQARKSRGFFDTILRRNKDKFRPTYNYKPDGGACRVYGSIQAKKVTANLHITTAGHGYRSMHHVDHSQMNLSHVITDFSFGPYFPDMAQPLKNTFELTHEPFIAYQYFLSVVPTTYIASNGKQVHTSQYSVTHYTRVLQHEQGTPGIFFKYDLEPLQMTIHQKTTTLVQFLIRVVGVVGGVWCCAGWAFRISSKAIDVVSGADRAPGIVAAEATGASTKRKWGGGELRARVARQGNGWVVDGGSPYGSYASTPVGSAFSPNPAPFSSGGGGGGSTLNTPGLYSPATAQSPYARAPGSATGANGGPYGLGLNSTPGSAAMFSAGTSGGIQSFAVQQQQHLQGGVLPPTPNPYAPTPSSGFPASPNLRSPPTGSFGPTAPAPPRRDSGKDEKKMD